MDSSSGSAPGAGFAIKHYDPSPRQDEYTSDFFTIFVGAERKVFTAHRDILSKSPKFNAQCNNEYFMETKTKEIELLDHDPTIFALLLEYLYKGDYWPTKGSEVEHHCDVAMTTRGLRARQQAELYTMAGYYHLPGLQMLAVEKMKLLSPLSLDILFSISTYVYANNVGPGAYREHFARAIKCGMTNNLTVVEDWVVERIREGGELAVDLYLVRRDLSEAAQKMQQQEQVGSTDRKRTFFSQFEQ